MYDVIILCGGYGTRIKPLLPDGLPKFLAPVWDERPVGIHLIEYLRRQKIIGNIVLATSYGREHIVKADLPVDGIDLWHEVRGIVPAILHAMSSRYSKTNMLKTDSVLILNGDTLFDFSLDLLFPGNNSATYYAIDTIEDYRKSAGITFLTQRMIRHYSRVMHDKRTEYRDLHSLPALIVPNSGRFLDIGTLKGYTRAQEPWP